jgi:hypothetical protein
MLGVTPVFGLPMLVAGAMIDPQGLHLWGLVSFTGIMLILLPIGAWYLFAAQLVVPTAGRSRLGAVFNLWIGGTLVGVAVICWIWEAMGYPRPDARVDASAHMLIPFMPRAGLALGLFCLLMLVSSGVVGAVAPILRPEVASVAALIGGAVLFAVVYGAGWALVAG